MGVHWGGISNRAVTETLLRMEQNSECRAHVVKQRCGGIGVHLWRSPPEWKPRCIWERGEYTIRRHNPDYPFRSVSWRPPSKTRRRSHSAVTMETTRGNGPWNFHAELFSFFFQLFSVQIDGERGRKSSTCTPDGWFIWMAGGVWHIFFAAPPPSSTFLPDGWSQTLAAGPRTSASPPEALHSQGWKTKAHKT